MYLKFALEQYIGRSGMIYNLLFILLIVVYDRKGRNMLNEFIRLGLSIDSINSSNAIQTLIWQETNYGKYYQTLVELHSGDAFLNWFLWLVTLPLPSFLFSFKSNLLLVNQILSEYVTGVAYGHMYYSVKLPSLFGESLYVFGSVFFWIHAALIGIFLNKYCGMLEKHSELGVLNIYIAASCLLIGRGGSSSLFPQAVNLIVFYSMIMFILHRLKNGKRRDIRSN